MRAEKSQDKNVRITSPLTDSRNRKALRYASHFAMERIYAASVSQPPTQHYALGVE